MIVWTAGHNMPGYLPEGDVVAFRTRLDALEYTCEELIRAADQLDEEDETFEEYENAVRSLREHDADVDGDWYDTFEDGRIAYWFQSEDMPDDEAREALGEEN